MNNSPLTLQHLSSALLYALAALSGSAWAQVAPTITSELPPNALLNRPYAYQVTASGTPAPTFSAANLPTGLSISSGGLISGTPTATGNFITASVTATNSEGADTQADPIVIINRPLTNCTDPGGVLSNNDMTCTFTVEDGGGNGELGDRNLSSALIHANAWGNYANAVLGNSIIQFAPEFDGGFVTIAHSTYTATPIIFSNVEIQGPPNGVTIRTFHDPTNARETRCLFLSGLPIAGTAPAPKPNDGRPQAIEVRLQRLTLDDCIAKSHSLAAGGAIFVNDGVRLHLADVQITNAKTLRTSNDVLGGNGLCGQTNGTYGAGLASWVDGGTTGGAGSGLGGEPGSMGGGGFGFSAGFFRCGSLGRISELQGFPQAAAGGANGGGQEPGHGTGGGGNTALGGGFGGNGTSGGVGGGGPRGFASGGGGGGFGGGGAAHPLGGGHGGFGGGGGSHSTQPGTGGFGAEGAENATTIGLGGFGAAGHGFGAGEQVSAGMGAGLFAVDGAEILFESSGLLQDSALDATSHSRLGAGMFLQGEGRLRLAPAASQSIDLLDPIADQRGSWPTLGFTADATFAMGGPFNGADWTYTRDGRWSLIKQGAGTLRLGGLNTYSGADSVVEAGVLQIAHPNALGVGAWRNEAIVEFDTPLDAEMGSNAQGMPAARFVQASSGTLRIGIGERAGLCAADTLFIGSPHAMTMPPPDNRIDLAGAIEIRNVGCTTPLAPNTPVTILTAPTISGAFANAANGATFASNGGNYRLNYVTDSNPATLDNVTLTILFAPPTVLYAPNVDTQIAFPGGAAGVADTTIAVTSSGGTAPGSVNVSSCGASSGFTISNAPINLSGTAGGTQINGSIALSCTRGANLQTGTLTCSETPNPGAVVIRSWNLSCPAADVPPTAVASAANVGSGGATSYGFTVDYTDDLGIHVASLGTGDVTVGGPNGFNATPAFVSVDINGNGTPRTATYSFTPPGGSWDAGDNGTYTLTMVAGQVTDTAGSAVAAGTIGSFTVGIGVPLAPTVSYTPGPGPIAFPAFPAAPAGSATRSISVSSSGGNAPGTVNVSSCSVSSGFTISNAPINLTGTAGGTQINGSIDLSCTRGATLQTGTLTCSETPSPGAVVIRSWNLICPAAPSEVVFRNGFELEVDDGRAWFTRDAPH